MTFVKPRIAQDTARRAIEHRWWHRFTPRRSEGAFAPSRKAADTIPRLELVYLPYYLLTVEAVFAGRSSETAATVEGLTGAFAVFDATRVEWEPQANGPCFPPRITEAEAVEIARNGLQMALLGSRGGSRKPFVGEVLRVEMLQYPYWVYYYERRKQRLDIKVLDAVSGGLPGPKVKTSLLAAFIDARKAANPPA